MNVKASLSRRNLLWFFLYCLLFIFYFFLIWKNYSRFTTNIEEHFGYLDIQENWRALDEFIKNRAFFRDYYFTYGWFILFLQSLIYLPLSQSFFAVVVARHLFLPVIGVVFAYIIGKNILKKTNYVFIFLFFNLFYGATMDFSPVRHLVAELALSFFIVYLFSSKKLFLIASGIVAGLSILTALEYGASLNITIIVFLIISIVVRSNLRIKDLLFFFISEFMVVAPFVFYLILHNALKNYVQFTLSLMNNFYFVSPCSASSFPRLTDIKELIPTSRWLMGGIPVEFLQSLNMYIVPFFYILVFVLLVYRLLRKGKVVKKDLAVGGITLYGSLIYLRTLDTPCIGYFRYGLVPFFLLITMLIEELFRLSRTTQSTIKKIYFIGFIGAIFVWFTLADNTNTVQSLFIKENNTMDTRQNTSSEKKLNKKIGLPIDKKQLEEYEEVTAYIRGNTPQGDTLFVYPWGPYNNLAELRATDTVQNSFAHLGGEKFVDKILIELKNKKPTFVIANLKNSGGNVRFGKKRDDLGLPGRYYSLSFEDGPVFSGKGNKIEKYILEHYKSVFHNDAAIVMKKRERKIPLDEPFQKVGEVKSFVDDPKKYSITGDAASWQIDFVSPIKASDFEIKFKVDGDFITKRLSRYIIEFFIDAQTVDKSRPFASVLATKDWQKTWISLHSVNEIKSIKIKVARNNGLAWWFNPYSLEIDGITFYNWENFLK